MAAALECARDGIRVNCVAPGFIDTEMTRGLSDAQRDALLARIPLGRLGQPDEIAATVVFLASEQAGYITGSTVHCKRCGKCPITGLVDLSEKYGVGLAVATGGTLARRIVVERRPHLIIAVACERDLSSGIQDSYPLPIFGIINRRPHGPCYDTQVDLEMVEQALTTFLLPGAVAAAAAPRTQPA